MILCVPDPHLRLVSEPLDLAQPWHGQVKQMRSILRQANGIGLAGVQIGLMKRLFIMQLDFASEAQVFLNPEIKAVSDTMIEFEEGCLSIPGAREPISRPGEIELRYVDLDGQEHMRSFGGLEARCIQHEMDHLNGVLFVDHLSRLKRERIIKKARKLTAAR